MLLLLSIQLNTLSSNGPELGHQVDASLYFKYMEIQCKFRSKLCKVKHKFL